MWGQSGVRAAGVENRARQKTQKQLRITFPWVREEGEQWESSLGKIGLRDRNSPMCTLSQNGYGGNQAGQEHCSVLRGAPGDVAEQAPAPDTEKVRRRALAITVRRVETCFQATLLLMCVRACPGAWLQAP